MVSPAVLSRHRKVLIDSGVWIYHFEQHPEFSPAAGRLLEALEEGRFRAVVSELTLLKLTVRPLQLGRQDVADEYELLLSHFPNVDLAPVSRQVLLDAAALRAKFRFRTPDAILLATGIRFSATAAVTNDKTWKEAETAGIQVILLSNL